MNRVDIASLIVPFCIGLACRGPAQQESASKPHENALPPVVVEAEAVQIRSMPRLLALAGSVTADRQSEVAANVPGRVVSAPIERGQTVKLGETLVTVDSRVAGFSAAASSAQAELADTQALQAQQDCARADRLYAEKAMAQSEYDRQKAQCKAQQLQAHAARAQAGMNTKLASDAVIRAPFTGAIGERYVNVGEYVQLSTKVASIYVIDPVRVVISVPEAAVGLVHVGQSLDVRVSAWPERAFPATVEYVSAALRRDTRDLLIEARAKNPNSELRPGMFATAQLAVGEESLPTVAEDAVVADGTIKRIFLAREGRAFELVIQTGAKKDGRVAVLEPLDASSRVIRHPPAGLRDGSAIAFGATVSAADPPGSPKPHASPDQP